MNAFVFLVTLPILGACTSLYGTAGPLELQTLSEDIVEGKYYDRFSGRVIQFTAKSDGSLSVVTSTGQSIVSIGSVFYTASYVEEVANRLVDIAGDSFLQQDNGNSNNEYYLFSSEAARIKSALSIGKVVTQETILQNIDKYDTKFHKEAVSNSIMSLVSDPHYLLISEAVHYMGETMKLTGRDYPSLLNLYLMTMKLEKIAEKQNDMANGQSRLPTSLECLQTCPPCPDNECLGLCGRNCDCWWWICGNCCYHYVCYRHDLQCFNCGFNSIQCLLTGPTKVPFRCHVNETPELTTECFF